MTLLSIACQLGKIVSNLSFLEGEIISESLYKDFYRNRRRFEEQKEKSIKYFDEVKESIFKYLERLQKVDTIDNSYLNNELEILSDMRGDAETGFHILQRQMQTTKDGSQRKNWVNLYKAYLEAINITLRLVRNYLQNDEAFTKVFRTKIDFIEKYKLNPFD